ncbi:hypothetical protein ACFQX6_15415 [Streptosporangium lutulentum]
MAVVTLVVNLATVPILVPAPVLVPVAATMPCSGWRTRSYNCRTTAASTGSGLCSTTG